MTSDALKPPSQRHIDNARENAELLMTLDDTTEWIDYLSSTDFQVPLVLIVLIVVAGGVVKAWIHSKTGEGK